LAASCGDVQGPPRALPAFAGTSTHFCRLAAPRRNCRMRNVASPHRNPWGARRPRARIFRRGAFGARKRGDSVESSSAMRSARASRRWRSGAASAVMTPLNEMAIAQAAELSPVSDRECRTDGLPAQGECFATGRGNLPAGVALRPRSVAEPRARLPKRTRLGFSPEFQGLARILMLARDVAAGKPDCARFTGF
jgi:hypothetical protein